jgi:transcriptional regulator with XRE-family HTH domain
MNDAARVDSAARLVANRALDTTLPGKFPLDRLVDGLREARIALGLTQAETARLSGQSPAVVGRLERGEYRNWYAAVRLRTTLALLELSAPLDARDRIAGNVTYAVNRALDQPTCTSCEATA